MTTQTQHDVSAEEGIESSDLLTAVRSQHFEAAREAITSNSANDFTTLANALHSSVLTQVVRTMPGLVKNLLDNGARLTPSKSPILAKLPEGFQKLVHSLDSDYKCWDSPLVAAAEVADYNIVSLLLKHSPDKYYHIEAIKAAIKFGNAQALEAFKDAGFNIAKAFKDTDTVISFAALKSMDNDKYQAVLMILKDHHSCSKLVKTATNAKLTELVDDLSADNPYALDSSFVSTWSVSSANTSARGSMDLTGQGGWDDDYSAAFYRDEVVEMTQFNK